MNNIRQVTINNITIDYLSFKDKYIVCFLDTIDNNALSFINNLYELISFNYYINKKLYKYTNSCGQNSNNICNALKQETNLINNYNIKPGKIIILKWANYTEEDYKKVKSIFGDIREQINKMLTYHSLVYIEFFINNKWYYITIETTKETPYKLQFCLGENKKDLDVVLSARYLCEKYVVVYDCNLPWTLIKENEQRKENELKIGGKRKKIIKRIKKTKKLNINKYKYNSKYIYKSNKNISTKKHKKIKNKIL
jgi:hypothetical protein